MMMENLSNFGGFKSTRIKTVIELIISKSLVLAAGKSDLDPEKPKYFHLLKINNPSWLILKGFLHKRVPKENADVLKMKS